MMTTTERKSIFISYSHSDLEWLKRLKIHLKPLEREYSIKVWDDSNIKIGDIWREEIRKALAECKAAILIISADFMASDFIATSELPPLLKSAQEDGVIVLPLIVSPSRFMRNNELSSFQAANNPAMPLNTLSRAEQEQILDELSARLEEIMSATISPDTKNKPNSASDLTSQIHLSIEHLRLGSCLILTNSSSDTVTIESVKIADQVIEYLDLRWKEISLPKLSRLSPGSSTMLMFAVTNKVTFNGNRLVNFESWETLEIVIKSASNKLSWRLISKMRISDIGNIEIQDEKSELIK